MAHISVVIPLYKCSLFINELSKRLINTLSSISEDFELIFVNDASPENDWEIVVELSKKDERIKGINFSRNFGQHYAITAGLIHAKGDWIVVMDGDLQDQPEEITKLARETVDESKLYFITKGTYKQTAYNAKTGTKTLDEGLVYVTGWLNTDYSVSGLITITTDKTWSATYTLETGR